MFWGGALGLALFLVAVALLIVLDPSGGPLAFRMQIAAIMSVSLSLFLVPMVICGFHRWRWDQEGLEFIGAFRRARVSWANLTEIRRTLDHGQLFRAAAGNSVRTSEYTVGVRLIAAAAAHYRPDLYSQ